VEKQPAERCIGKPGLEKGADAANTTRFRNRKAPSYRKGRAVKGRRGKLDEKDSGSQKESSTSKGELEVLAP